MAAGAKLAGADSFVRMESATGDYIGQGLNWNMTTAGGTFTAQKNYDNGVTVSYSGSGSWSFSFAAPGDALLTPGTMYQGAVRFPFQSSAQDISSFAGQRIHILIQAADASTASLVEAAVDNVRITQQQ